MSSATYAPVLAQDLADVDDHVQFAGAVVHGSFGLGHLDGCEVAAVGKADHRSHGHGGAGQDISGQTNAIRFDTDRSDAIISGQAAALFQVGIRQRGLEQGVVNHAGHVGIAELRHAVLLRADEFEIMG